MRGAVEHRLGRQRPRLGGDLLVTPLQEARAWSYGAALTMLSRAYSAGHPCEADIITVVSRIAELQRSDGHFRLGDADGRAFVRHEAHLFAGLADLTAVFSCLGRGRRNGPRW